MFSVPAIIPRFSYYFDAPSVVLMDNLTGRESLHASLPALQAAAARLGLGVVPDVKDVQGALDAAYTL